MPVLNIDLMTPDGVLFEGNEIPDDLQGKELVSCLVNTMGLPRVSPSDEPIEYSLEIANQGVKLQDGQTLGDAGATNGDVIRLVSSYRIQKPLESQSIPEPVANGAIPATGENTPATDKANGKQTDGDSPVLVIRPTSSVTRTIRRLKDGLGLKTEDISVLDHSRMKEPAPAGQPPPKPGSRRRTAMLGAMLIAGCLFLAFAIYSKKRTVPVAQASEVARVQAPTPELTPEPTPAPTLEPAPAPSIIPMPTPKFRPRAVPTASPAPAASKPQWRPQPRPVIVVQQVVAPPPEEPKKRCGFWRKVFVGCKKSKTEKREEGVGGAVGAAKSAAISNGRSAIRRGVNYPTRRIIP